jgi:metal-responsive CopG/Arc/MetJ family transcriptional regulator
MQQNTKRQKAKSSRVLISLPDKFLGEIDEVADTEQRTRSELIREALRQYLSELGTNTNDVFLA